MIIDCDPGHDDALALLLASHLAEVVAVTTVSGNAPLAAVTRNAQALATLMGGEVPVYSGAERALAAGENDAGRHATHVHGPSGLDGVDLPGSSAELRNAQVWYASMQSWLLRSGSLSSQLRLRKPGRSHAVLLRQLRKLSCRQRLCTGPVFQHGDRQRHR